MTFEEILPKLKVGKVFSRTSWPESMIIFKQNDNDVNHDIIPKMTSLPAGAKNLLMCNPSFFLSYRSQVIKVDLGSGTAKNYVPDWEDIFARDWIECTTEHNLYD